MRPSRLNGMAGIGVDRMGNLADAAKDPEILRLENLDTDITPPQGVIQATRADTGQDDANSYLPFLGMDELRQAAAKRVSSTAAVDYPWRRTTIICAGGLNGVLNCLLALIEPGDEVLLPDPVYIGLINRVRLAGGTPVFLPFRVKSTVWELDLDRVAQLVTPKTRMFLMMSPVMPSGAVLKETDWRELSRLCVASNAWMLVNGAMERILFDGLKPIHPASFPGMADRTITVGSASKEQRMIGWRVGWVTAPAHIIDDIALVNISNVVCNVGMAQRATALALAESEEDFQRTVRELERRRDTIIKQLADYPVIKPSGGWSLLMDCQSMGHSPEEASIRLMTLGKVAATPMLGWGQSDRYLRFVFSNEPVPRLASLRDRMVRTFG